MGGATMASSFFWYELLTTDTAAAEAFYKAVIGWEAEAFLYKTDDYNEMYQPAFLTSPTNM